MEKVYYGENYIGLGRNYTRCFYTFKNLSLEDLVELLSKSFCCSKKDMFDIDNATKPTELLENCEQFKNDLIKVATHYQGIETKERELVPLFFQYFRPYCVEIEAFDKSWKKERNILVVERKIPIAVRKQMHKLAQKVELLSQEEDDENLF